jgi:hypothetical protein
MSINNNDWLTVDVDDTLNYTINSSAIDTLTIDNSSYNWGTSVTNAAMTFQDATTRFDCDVNISESRDLKIGDRSLKEFMGQVEERLNILHPNPELEEKWNDLAELGKRYRKLEAEILEKERMWKILKDR